MGMGVVSYVAGEQVVTREAAARLAQIRVQRVDYWVDTLLIGASVDRRIGHRRHMLLDYNQLMSLMVAAELRRRSITLPHIRRIVERIKSRGFASPLSQLVFATRGRELYFQSPDGLWEGGKRPDQSVIPEVLDLDSFRVRIRQGTRRPATAVGNVERRRGTMGSKPVFSGTRVPVATVHRYLQAGKSEGDILKAFPTLTSADIATARQSA